MFHPRCSTKPPSLSFRVPQLPPSRLWSYHTPRDAASLTVLDNLATRGQIWIHFRELNQHFSTQIQQLEACNETWLVFIRLFGLYPTI